MIDELQAKCDEKTRVKMAIKALENWRNKTDAHHNELRILNRRLRALNQDIKQLRNKVQMRLPLPYPDQADQHMR